MLSLFLCGTPNISKCLNFSILKKCALQNTLQGVNLKIDKSRPQSLSFHTLDRSWLRGSKKILENEARAFKQHIDDPQNTRIAFVWTLLKKIEEVDLYT